MWLSGAVTRTSGGGTSTGTMAAQTPEAPQSIFGQLTSGGGLFGGLAAVLNTTTTPETATVTAYADAPASAPSTTGGANEVIVLG